MVPSGCISLQRLNRFRDLATFARFFWTLPTWLSILQRFKSGKTRRAAIVAFGQGLGRTTPQKLQSQVSTAQFSNLWKTLIQKMSPTKVSVLEQGLWFKLGNTKNKIAIQQSALRVEKGCHCRSLVVATSAQGPNPEAMPVRTSCFRRNQSLSQNTRNKWNGLTTARKPGHSKPLYWTLSAAFITGLCSGSLMVFLGALVSQSICGGSVQNLCSIFICKSSALPLSCLCFAFALTCLVSLSLLPRVSDTGGGAGTFAKAEAASASFSSIWKRVQKESNAQMQPDSTFLFVGWLLCPVNHFNQSCSAFRSLMISFSVNAGSCFSRTWTHSPTACSTIIQNWTGRTSTHTNGSRKNWNEVGAKLATKRVHPAQPSCDWCLCARREHSIAWCCVLQAWGLIG